MLKTFRKFEEISKLFRFCYVKYSRFSRDETA